MRLTQTRLWLRGQAGARAVSDCGFSNRQLSFTCRSACLFRAYSRRHRVASYLRHLRTTLWEELLAPLAACGKIGCGICCVGQDYHCKIRVTCSRTQWDEGQTRTNAFRVDRCRSNVFRRFFRGALRCPPHVCGAPAVNFLLSSNNKNDLRR